MLYYVHPATLSAHFAPPQQPHVQDASPLPISTLPPATLPPVPPPPSFPHPTQTYARDVIPYAATVLAHPTPNAASAVGPTNSAIVPAQLLVWHNLV
jgi:hypothetical protein